jgi:putative FmdB family regulatory protein
MPLYEYECRECHRHTEKIQKFSDAEITVCPHCGGPLERVISAPAIAFKGGGWYADGYGNKKTSGAGGETKSGDSKGGESKSSESKSDSGSKSSESAGSSSKDSGGSSGSSAAASSTTSSAPSSAGTGSGTK